MSIYTSSPVIIRIISAVALLLTGTLLFAGPLNPPVGPVASTAKTLFEVQPRIAVNATNTPGDTESVFEITLPGSYYLTGNVTGVNGKHGIKIAGAATLDLNGFEVVGVGGSLDGVRSMGPSCVIINGSIRNWGGNGLATFASAVRVERVQSCFNRENGFGGSPGSTFTHCTATGNGLSGFGVATAVTIASCTANDNTSEGIYAGQGSTIIDCRAISNGENGILLGFGCTVTNCIANYNSLDGIRASNGTTIAGCSTSFNDGNGIFAFSGITISRCTMYLNSLSGIDASGSCTIEDCIARSNVIDGIQCTSSCVVRNNIATSNGAGAEFGAGIHATGGNNRIEGNNCTSNDYGIDIDAAGSIIIRNTCADNGLNFIVAVNNVFGTIADRTAPASPAVAGSSAAGTMGSTDPNANFAY